MGCSYPVVLRRPCSERTQLCMTEGYNPRHVVYHLTVHSRDRCRGSDQSHGLVRRYRFPEDVGK